MDPKRDKPPLEPMNCSSMQQMMERMRSAGGCSPAAMCQRIMASFGTPPEGEAETPEPPRSPEERARGEDAARPRSCCGHQPEGAPKGT